MRQHEFTVDLPQSARRLWALFQRYDLWKEYAPAVLDVEIVYPGDAEGNGLLRRVVYPLPFGRRGESFELVKNVRANQGYDYVMLRTGRGSASASDSTSRRRGSPGSRARSTASSTRRTSSPCAAPRPGSRPTPSSAPTWPTDRAERVRAGGDDAE